MARSLVIGLLAFVIAAIVGSPAVRALRARKVGKAISVDGPASHAAKAGTPTMGGLLVLATVLLVTVAFNLAGHRSILLPFGMMAVLGVAGYIDDLGSLLGRGRSGLTWRLKLGLLAALGLAGGVVLYRLLGISSVAVPLYGHLALGLWIVPLSVPIVMCTTTAVAITDGMDGLLAGSIAVAFTAYGVIAAVQGQSYLTTFCFTVTGAALGFLWYNAHPALVFMGESGALPLGAALAIVALMTEQWVVLPLIGVIFVANGLSDVVQIVYFKATHGRRILRMAPLHNHFELAGWPETRIVTRFWLIGVAGALLGIAAARTL